MWDSIGSSATGDIASESTVKEIMGYNDRLRKQYNVASWFIHHNRKATADNKKPNKLSDVYGNQYLTARATSVYCLYPAGEAIEVIPLKKRMAKMESPWGIKRVENLNFELQSVLGNVASNTATVFDFPGTDNELSDDDLEGSGKTRGGLDF
jgi:hypothetical protein